MRSHRALLRCVRNGGSGNISSMDSAAIAGDKQAWPALKRLASAAASITIWAAPAYQRGARQNKHRVGQCRCAQKRLVLANQHKLRWRRASAKMTDYRRSFYYRIFCDISLHRARHQRRQRQHGASLSASAAADGAATMRMDLSCGFNQFSSSGAGNQCVRCVGRWETRRRALTVTCLQFFFILLLWPRDVGGGAVSEYQADRQHRRASAGIGDRKSKQRASGDINLAHHAVTRWALSFENVFRCAAYLRHRGTLLLLRVVLLAFVRQRISARQISETASERKAVKKNSASARRWG